MNLKEAAEKLRDYLVEHDFAGDDGDIPDEIWKPFCEALLPNKLSMPFKACTTCGISDCEIREKRCSRWVCK